MTARDFSDAVEAAWETAGLHSLRETERPRFVTDCGAALISRDCGQYLDIMDIGHMLASSYHP